jgi:hypothetical protein
VACGAIGPVEEADGNRIHSPSHDPSAFCGKTFGSLHEEEKLHMLTAAIWGYSQMMGPQDMYGCPWMTQSQVQSMQKHPMMGWYTHMGRIQLYPGDPMSILAWKDELDLSDSQADQLKAIDERAIADAKAVLSDEQKTKLARVTKGWKPMSMNQCWNLMNR